MREGEVDPNPFTGAAYVFPIIHSVTDRCWSIGNKGVSLIFAELLPESVHHRMEIRFKYNKGLLWITGIFFLLFTVLAFWIPDSWWLALVMGLVLIGELFFYRSDKENDLVIDEWGIHQVKGVDYKWHQIDHCYIEGRLNGTVSRPTRYPYLIIVLKSGKRVPIDLSAYKFNRRVLLNAIDEASGKSLCHRDDHDSRYEKTVWKKEYKSIIFGGIIGLIIFFIWLFCSSVS